MASILSDEEIDIISKHWIKTSDKDFKTMTNLFRYKEYYWSLFIGHLVIEKLLKAFYVINKKHQAPFTHNLLRLSELSELIPDQKQSEWLDSITAFNINSRYDSYKHEFYKRCNKKFTKEWIDKISELRRWIKSKLS